MLEMVVWFYRICFTFSKDVILNNVVFCKDFFRFSSFQDQVYLNWVVYISSTLFGFSYVFVPSTLSICS
jgi:hypothetical protein